ncbi:hypothetical protein KAR91_22035 [Candidatus Pacearchaeota archaeon]|nr:hypothetical protein [Candidatus Pacearchaeota archaeon]
MIDIITTATVRPKILRNTYRSFVDNMIDPTKCRLIINIDQIGEDVHPTEVLDVAEEFFPNIVHRFAETPSFVKAVIWCWKQTYNEFVLHLEDDWLLQSKVDVKEMIEIHKDEYCLASLKLSKQPIRPTDFSKRRKFVWEDRISLNPNLIKKRFINNICPLMTEDKNPEKQIRENNPVMKTELQKWRFGIYTGCGYTSSVKDVGRPWMEKTNFKKPIGFMKWETKQCQQ